MVNLEKINDMKINDFISKYNKMKRFIEDLEEFNSREHKDKVLDFCDDLNYDITKIENQFKKEKEEMSIKVQELIDMYTTKFYSM